MNPFFQMGKFLWIFLLFPCLVLAQSERSVTGIVLDAQSKGVAKVKVSINGGNYLESDAAGKFTFTLAKGKSVENVQIVKRGFAIASWENAAKEGELFKILLKNAEYVLIGKVFDGEGELLPNAEVVLQPDDPVATVRTNNKGVFQIPIPEYVRVNEQSVFRVNGKVLPKESVSYQEKGDIYLLRIPPASIKVIFYDAQNRKLANQSVEIAGKSYQTNDAGEARIPLGTVNPSFKVAGYQIGQVKHLPYDFLYNVYIQKEASATGETANEPVAQVAPVQDTVENFDYNESFNYLVNQLEMEKQQLIQRSNEIRNEMEKIARQLEGEENINPAERQMLESNLSQLEETLIETDLAYEDAQMETRKILDEMRQAIAVRDSLTQVANEQIVEIQQEREEVERELKRNILIFSIIILSLGAISGILLVTGRRIRHQRNELKLVNGQLEATKLDLEEKMRVINQKNLEITHQAERVSRLHQEVSLQNQKMTDNIRYAKTVQEAILPPIASLRQVFHDFFVVYHPKDIVSGDFYWMYHLPALNGKPARTFIAAVDCTGHGVSGAFMSMIGNTLLHEIVNQKHIYETDRILAELNQGVIEGLRQKENTNDDGMDVAICCLTQQPDGTTQVHFSGAKRPLYHFRQASGQLEVWKGDRASVGGLHAKVKTFTSQQIDLQKGDALYLFSDGITDQHNAKREKLGSEALRQFLENNGNKPMGEQKDLIENLLEEHKKDCEQRDDMLLIGVRV